MLCNFLVWMLKYFLKNLKMFSCPQKVEKTTSKIYLWQLGGFFFSAVPTAQNSPDLHFRFITKIVPDLHCFTKHGIFNSPKSVLSGDPL